MSAGGWAAHRDLAWSCRRRCWSGAAQEGRRSRASVSNGRTKKKAGTVTLEIRVLYFVGDIRQCTDFNGDPFLSLFISNCFGGSCRCEIDYGFFKALF